MRQLAVPAINDSAPVQTGESLREPHLPPIDESEPHYTLELRIHLHGEPK